MPLKVVVLPWSVFHAVTIGTADVCDFCFVWNPFLSTFVCVGMRLQAPEKSVPVGAGATGVVSSPHAGIGNRTGVIQKSSNTVNCLLETALPAAPLALNHQASGFSTLESQG